MKTKINKEECERCGEYFEFLYMSFEGMVCFDCQAEIDDKEEDES